MSEPRSTADHYRYPFIPRDFYYIPVRWLYDVTTTGDLDASDLLMVMVDEGSGTVAFPDDADEAAWTRDATINFVSHVTYGRYVAERIAAGELLLLGQHPARYTLSHHADFNQLGVLYRPRNYVWLRWTQWFGKNRWGPRAALVGLLAKMAQAQFDGSAERPREPAALSVTVSARAIRTAAERLLPRAGAGAKVLLGLQHLAGLGVIEVVADGGKRHDSIRYRLTGSALDHPPAWPLTEIARLCALDPAADEPWLELIQTCLRLTGRPLNVAPQVWASIRRYDPDISTEEDARAARAYIERTAAYTQIGLRRALHDFTVAHRAEARQNWVYGKWFTLFVQEMNVAENVLMPKVARHTLQATQLEVYYARERLSIEDACKVAASTELSIIQNDRLLSLVPALRPDRYDLLEHSRFRCNHLHAGRLNYTDPFGVLLHCRAPQPGLMLRCRFRVLQPTS